PGIPVMRAPFYEYNDMRLYKEDYDYMLGSDVFVAPVITQGACERSTFVPEGEWIHLLTGENVSGGAQKISAPLGIPLVLYKKDSAFAEVFEGCKII
ncbi:MAG: glycoside hydrolase family 31 protein, partial [Clostridia bacterium]|nr:glycoside hydrolase family 31 protein [Clostridia bacterium]